MKVRGDFLGPPRSTDKTTLIIKVSKGAKIRNRYNLDSKSFSCQKKQQQSLEEHFHLKYFPSSTLKVNLCTSRRTQMQQK